MCLQALTWFGYQVKFMSLFSASVFNIIILFYYRDHNENLAQ